MTGMVISKAAISRLTFSRSRRAVRASRARQRRRRYPALGGGRKDELDLSTEAQHVDEPPVPNSVRRHSRTLARGHSIGRTPIRAA